MQLTESSPEIKPIIDYLMQSAGPKLNGQPISMDTPLLDSGILDSLGILQLMTFLSEELGIEVADEDFVPENFDTVTSLARFVASKRNSA